MPLVPYLVFAISSAVVWSISGSLLRKAESPWLLEDEWAQWQNCQEMRSNSVGVVMV